MTLVAERKLSDLIDPPKGGEVLEASGVVAKGGYYYVIFDNVRRVARIHSGLQRDRKGIHGSAARAPARATRTLPSARTRGGSTS